ncbi:MAG: serine protease [Marinilabiliales bacterium]|nr:MAG: serine protease [Marinilabiliales bacterium]
MKFKALILVLFLFTQNLTQALADEGMWLPILLETLNEDEMQSMGFKLTAEDIYSINHGSMKDGVVLFGRGCTAEIVSDQGLILTNHHCGYGSIARHSSVDNDLLTDGFWAMSQEEELKNDGLTATILVRMEDVTAQVMEFIEDGMTESERQAAIEKASNKIVAEATANTHYDAKVKAFYYGNEFYLFVYEVFEDVRLVGAPPSSIGKFGGDTDNWMWPRHTGDFSVFRIYADKDNKPAAYSKDNVPYKPKYFFPISLKGVQENDFTFVFGYPGTTQHYTLADGVQQITEEENPVAISLRRTRMDIMEKYMALDNATRIQYASKIAGVANYWKKMMGESKGIRQWNGIRKKTAEEEEFEKRVQANPELKAKYGTLMAEFDKVYEEIRPYNAAFNYFFEGVWSIEALKYAWSFNNYISAAITDPNSNELPRLKEDLEKKMEGHFNGVHNDIDREVCGAMLAELEGMGKDFLPEYYFTLKDEYKADWNNCANTIYENSYFTSAENNTKFFALKNKKIKMAAEDPMYKLATGFIGIYLTKIQPGRAKYEAKLDSLYRIYVQALSEVFPEKRMWPDANSTLRVAYGKVQGYDATDAVKYDWYTTLAGVIEKEDPAIADYYVDEKLENLYYSKDYGMYADSDGTMHVGFIATNHTTGGNSGSPVLNANGELVGINFDRVWEGTMSDLMFDPNKCRNISVDIRYVLFIIDKYAGASHLVEEMKLIK